MPGLNYRTVDYLERGDYSPSLAMAFGTRHVIVGAGEASCVVLAVGARDRSAGPGWGGYSVDEAALRHGAGVVRETTDQAQAYAQSPRREATRYGGGWLPG